MFTLALTIVLVVLVYPADYLFASPVEHHGIDSMHVDLLPAPVSVSLGNLNLGVAAYDSRSGVGYLMYSEERVHTRFADTPPSQWNADHLIAVLYIDNQWLVDRNEFTLEPFTPRPTDRLLAEIDFAENIVSNLEGIDSTIHDIRAGFTSSDLVVIPETWGGEPDEGEFWVQGTEFVIENSDPVVEIIEGPASDTTITINNPLFAWTATDEDGFIDAFAIDLSGPSPLLLTITDTLYQYTELANGDYTFCVTAQDNAGGNSTEACRSFSVDVPLPNEAPTIEITDGPEEGAVIDVANPAFAWSGTDTDGTIDSFFVSLNGPVMDSLATAESTLQYQDLLNGAYTFCVTARDDASDLSLPACRSFAIEVPIPNVPPTVQITNGPADSTTIDFNNPAFTWSGEDTDGIVDSFLVSLNGPTPDSFATANTFIQYSGRQNGEYTFCIQAKDDDGDTSVSACRFFIIEVPTNNTPPSVQITNGPAEGSTIDFNNPAFSWSGEDAEGEIDSFYVELRGPSFTALSTRDTFYQFAELLNGDHEFCVRATDQDGVFSSWACRSFSVFIPTENVLPTVTIENAPAADDTLTYNNPAFTWSGEDLDGTVDSFFVDLQGPTPVTFTTTATFHQFTELENGSYSFCIQSKDNLEALSEQACLNFALIVPDNNESPTVAIENGPEDQSIITINNPAFTWVGEDTDGTVDAYNIELIGPTTIEFTVSDTFYQFSPLPSGSYTFCIQAVDNNGALSSFACRQFQINSGISGSLKDVLINSDGAFLQIPMAQQAVGIYQSEVFITSITTDGQGVFSLQGQYGDGTYSLRSEFLETIVGIDEPVAIQREMAIHDESNFELIIPRTLATDQFEILSNLANVTISSDLLEAESEPATLSSMYDVGPLDALLRSWIGDLDQDITPYLDTMQRIYIATEAMERSLADAAYLSHEQSETLFNMLQVYLTSSEFLSKATAQLTDTGDLNLEDALRVVLNHIDALIYEMAINTPARYAAAFTPSPYHQSYFDALLLMYETVVRETVFDPTVGTRFSQGYSASTDRNRIKLAANQAQLHSLYLADTQGMIHQIADQSAQFDIQGSFTEAFNDILSTSPNSIASQRQALAKQAIQHADSLQQRAQTTEAGQLVAALINSQANYAALQSASSALRTTAFEQSGKALIYTGSALAQVQDFAHQSAAQAFNSDTVFVAQFVEAASIPSPTPVHTTPGVDEEALIAQLDNILWFIEQGNRDVVVTMLDDLTVLDGHYEAALAALQGQLWVAAEDLVTTTPGLQSIYEDLLASRITSLKRRIQLYVDLLRYAGFEPVTAQVLTAQRDSVVQSIAQTGFLSRQLNIGLTSADRPFIAVTSHQTVSPLIAPGIPSEVVATVRNTGTQPANQITLTLKADSLVSFLSPPSFIIPTLDAGQETTIRWEFVIQEHIHSGGLYVVEAQMAGEKELYSSGVYKVGVERTVTTSTEDLDGIPLEHALYPNYPNPFTSETTLRFDLPDAGDVTFTLFDIVGREVMTVLDASMPAGKHSVRVDARGIPSGTYVLRMVAGGYQGARTLVVVR